MCYRCEVCDGVVPHGLPMLRHVVHRPNKEIEREWRVCQPCKHMLDRGMELEIMLRSGFRDSLHEAEALLRERRGRDGVAAHDAEVLAQVRRNGQPVQVGGQGHHMRERADAAPPTTAKERARKRLPMTPPPTKRVDLRGSEEGE